MDAAVDRPNALRTGASSTDDNGKDPIVLGDTITPAQTPAPNTTGLTPRLGAAVIAPGLQLPELTLAQAPVEQRPRCGSETDGMKRVRSKNVLGDAPKAPRVDVNEDAPTARRRAESFQQEPSLNFFEEPTRSGYTPEKETRERSSTQELTDDQQDESDSDSSDDDAAIAWLQRQKRPSATPSKRSSAGSRRRSSASQALSPPPPPPPQPESPTLPGFSRKTRESESARKERAAARPAPSPKPPPPPRSESSDDGGLDDLQAIHTAPRSREKHSRSHSQGVARAMAIAKRNGQRSASRGGG